MLEFIRISYYNICIKEKGVLTLRKNIYISEDDKKNWDKLGKISEKKDRSISWLVNKAIEQYIKKFDDSTER